FPIRANGHIVVSNLAYFVPNPEVKVLIDGAGVRPDASDFTSSIYSCKSCTDRSRATVIVTSMDITDVDIVTI
ncbi:MAG: hypothetical protein WBW61_11160, partial [Rhodanobacteraceae bacterium]